MVDWHIRMNKETDKAASESYRKMPKGEGQILTSGWYQRSWL
jgi:hypothetical protein